MQELDMNLLVSLVSLRPDIPDGKIEDVSISHEIKKDGELITIVSMRNSIFMGGKPTKVKLDGNLKIRKLKYEGGTWMTDSPQEVWQMRDILKIGSRKVLVGGLGLGTISHLLSMTVADYVTTIEIDERINDLVAPHISSNEIIIDDLFKFCQQDKLNFNYAFFDIWQSTGEMTWEQYVVPLRRLCRNKISQQNIVCWNENEMIGQLHNMLYRVASLRDMTFPSISYNVFRDACKQLPLENITEKSDVNYHMKITSDNAQNPQLIDLVQLFTKKVATDEWEQKFGDLWDKYTLEKGIL